MKIRNDTDRDFHLYNLHLSQGSVVELPAGMKQSKVDFLCRMFTVVPDAPAAAPKPAPVVETAEITVPLVVEDPAEPADEPTTTPAEPVRAKCGAEPPADHDDPLAWLERHASRCFSCRIVHRGEL